MELTFAQVILSRNQEERLPQAIESVLGQSPPADEIVIGDDASSDGSPELIRAYQRRHSGRVTALFSDKQLGIAANANRSIRATHSAFVSVLAGDDYLLPGKFEAQFACARRHVPEHEVIYSDCYLEIESSGRRRLWSNGGREGRVFSWLARRRFFMRNAFFSRRLFDEIGGFDPSLELYEDWKMKLELSLRTKVKHCPGVFSIYVQSAEGTHNRPRSDHRRCVAKLCADLAADHELSARDLRYLRGAAKHFDYLAATAPGAKLRAALAAWRADPYWAVAHTRLAIGGLRRGLRVLAPGARP